MKGGEPVSNCTSGNWCCGTDDCCSDSSKLLQLGIGNLETTLGVATASAAATSLRTTSTSTTDSSVASPTLIHSPDETAVKVGAGVGVPLGLLLVGAIAYGLFFLRRKRTQNKIRELSSKGYGRELSTWQQLPSPHKFASELYDSSNCDGAELPGARERAELNGSGRAQLSDIVVK